MDGEYYIQSEEMETSLRDVRLYIRYCKMRVKNISFFNFGVSLLVMIFSLTTERTYVRVCGCLTAIFVLLQLVSQYLPMKWSLRLVEVRLVDDPQFLISLVVGLFSQVIVLIYWISLIMRGVQFWVLISNCLNMISSFLIVCTRCIGTILGDCFVL